MRFKGTNLPRLKSKRNPKHICFICGDKIVNNQINAIYCNICGRTTMDIKHRFGGLVYRLRKQYPDFDVKYKTKITRLKLQLQ